MTTPLGQPPTARGRRTRSALLHAAREVFEDVGYLDAKIADIADVAGMSYGSVYNYFESKEAIFREVVNSVTGEMFQASRGNSGESSTPVDRIREATSRYVEAYGRNAKIMGVIEQVSPRDDYFSGLLTEIRSMFHHRAAQGIERLKSEGLADANINVDLAARVLGGMVENHARQRFLFGEVHDDQEALEMLTLVWARAIGLDVHE